MPCFSNQNVPWLAPCCACRASNAGPLQLLLSTGLHGWWGEEELYQALQEATSVKVGLWLTNWCTIASWVFTSVAPDASLILLIEQILYRLYTFILIHLTSLYISLHLLFYSVPSGLNSASTTTVQQLRLSNYASATTPQQLRISNYASATTTQQPRLSNHGSATKLGSRFSNHASATKIYSRFSNQTSATKTHPLWQATYKVTSYTSYENPTPSGKYMQSHILHVIWKSHPLWQVHAQSHLTRQIKIPPPLASTCTVSSYTSYQNPTPSGKHIQSLILHVISKIQPTLASTCTVSSYTSYQNPTPSGKYMHSLIFHFKSKSRPLWQVRAQSHVTRHIKIPPPLASTCAISSYTSYQNPTPSGKYMQGHILHVISKSHPLWQVHAQSHRLILHIIWKSHPLWQVHAQSHLTRHIKIQPTLASTCTVSSYTSYQNPVPSGKHIQSHILRFIWKSPPLWQAHTKSHLNTSYGSYENPTPLASTCTVSSYTSYQNPTPSGKYMHSLILHVKSKSRPLRQVRAQSHLTRHIKIPPPLASTRTVSSYTSYQNPTPSGKYMQGHILHVISKSHPLWQVHAQSHLTRQIKIPPPLASTCTVSSYTSYQNPTPSGKYMHSLTLHIISKSHPPLASTCTVLSYTFTDLGLRSIVYEPCFTSHGLRIIVYEPCFTSHGLRIIVYEPWFTSHGLRIMVYEPWFASHGVRIMVYEPCLTSHGLRIMVYEPWFTSHGLRIMVYEPWFTSHGLRIMVYEPCFTSHGLRITVYEPCFYQSLFTNHGLRTMVYESWFTNHGLRAMFYESWFTNHGLRAMFY